MIEAVTNHDHIMSCGRKMAACSQIIIINAYSHLSLK